MYIYIIVIKHSSHWTQASVLRFSCSVLSTGYEPWALLAVPSFCYFGWTTTLSISTRFSPNLFCWILLFPSFNSSSHSSDLAHWLCCYINFFQHCHFFCLFGSTDWSGYSHRIFCWRQDIVCWIALLKSFQSNSGVQDLGGSLLR